jgi:large-conductance mechanosensitive channel
MRSPLKLSVILLLVAHTGTLLACPDCALRTTGGQIEPQTLASKDAFSNSTLCMLAVFFLILGFMIFTMIKTCKELQPKC